MSGRARVAALISGEGTNMSALVEAAQAPACPYEVVLVLSNAPEAAGLKRARALGVEAVAVDHRKFGSDREAHERAVDAELSRVGADWVALAGYMRVLTPWLVRRWAGRMLNIHPSLLPRHPGLRTHARALEAGDAVHGCTVHWVTEGLDAGTALAKAEVPVLPGDTAVSLAARVLAAEHRLYPQVLADAVRRAGG